MIVDELIKAKNGDVMSANKIITHYNNFINYLMNEYGIIDKIECYDIVIEKILKTFEKFEL